MPHWGNVYDLNHLMASVGFVSTSFGPSPDREMAVQEWLKPLSPNTTVPIQAGPPHAWE